MEIRLFNSIDLRKKFIDFFIEKGHQEVIAAPLLLESDPSVLFTTAGMQQFRRYYLEPTEAPSGAIVTIQPCFRTSDINEVGDSSHLTFFEMMGNFSFGYPKKQGSYFKKEAIEMGWKFLVQELGIKRSRISATYFKGGQGLKEDEESLKILSGIDGLGKIEGGDFKDNFWSLESEMSPGGPTVEFYIDGLEVWNLVFNEYIFHKGKYLPSKFKGVDTGMGLERLLAVLQGEKDIYKTELFWSIIEILEKKLPLRYEREKKDLRIISDHLKAAAFLIFEEIEPSNKERGYVLRKLIRRILLHSQIQQLDSQWLSEALERMIALYPRLKTKKERIKEVIEIEFQKFHKTLERGKKIIENLEELDAKVAFDLYQTYGFPFELSKEYAAMKGVKISEGDFQREFERHRDLSRTASAGMFKGGLVGQTEKTIKYHTATHLLLAALRQILGDQVFQRGSNITEERLRFDFSYPQKMTDEQIKKVETLVNKKIAAGLPVKMEEISLDEAKKSGAIGVFEAKYGDRVKVYSIGDFSKEICGGPHVKNTYEIGKFKIIKEESSSAGVRRIKAVLK